ncbi:myosin light chain kinase, smooth muscle [Aulostomus maculatus]
MPQVRGHPAPQVTWFREGQAVIGGERCVMEQGGRGNFSLVVGGVRQEDLGCYTCQAANQAGSRQVTVTILLEEDSGTRRALPSPMKTGCRSFRRVEPRSSIWSESPPKFVTKPSQVFARLGQTGKFSVKITGRPKPQVTWFKGETELQSCGRVDMCERNGRHFLEIKEVCLEDTGCYMCSVINNAGTATATAKLSVLDSPESSSSGNQSDFSPCRSQPTELPQKRTSVLTVESRAPSRPAPQLPPVAGRRAVVEAHQVAVPVQTASAHQPAAGSNSSRDGRRSGSVLRSKVGPPGWEPADGEQGTFTLQGKLQGHRAKVTEVRGVCEPPRFIIGLMDQKVLDGSKVAMMVELSGHPPPEVLWLHDGQEVKESEDFHFLRDQNRCTLLIQEVFPEDNGTYSCQAWNHYGEDHTQACLTVEEPQDGIQPWFITKPKPVSATVGQHVFLSCAIAGDPFPQYTWTRTGLSRPLTSGGDYELLQKEDVTSLLIRRVQKHHAGEYLVSLRNVVGECAAVVHLSVCDGQTSDGTRGHAGDDSSLVGAAGTRGTRGATKGGVTQLRGSSGCVTRQCLDVNQEQQQGGALNLQQNKEAFPTIAKAPPGLLRRCLDIQDCKKVEWRQTELNSHSLLGRQASGAKHNPGQELGEASLAAATNRGEMDFKANLKGVKSKMEEERKLNSPQQVDFRGVLGKKTAASNKSAETPGKNATDFRSVLTNKKKAVEKNGESDKVAVNNCVSGGINERKSGGGGGAALEFTEKLSDVTVLDGQQLRLQCRLSVTCDVTVSWTLDSKVVKPSKFIVLANEGGLCSLTIDKALPEDEGQYRCRAESSAGKAECSCMVLVDDPSENSLTDKNSKKATATSESEARIKKPTAKTPQKQALPPQILQFPEDMKILAGQSVEITCKFSGAPPISCTWLKFKKPIQGGSADISIQSSDSSSKLTISSGQQEHCGCYTVELRNSYGLRQAALNLTIVDKPDPPAKVPAASDIRRSSLTLSWYGPTYDGGSVVQSYKLEIWDSVETQWKSLVSCNSTSYNVQNLLPDRQYKFRVRAENMYGVGEPSAESEPVTVGLVDDDENQEEAEEEDEDSEKEPDYRDVTIRTDMKVKELYDVEERLGTGKFGQVFKLVEKATRKVWAGKFIKAYSAKEKENVRQEIGIMNSLHHPKLVQCIDAFEGKSDIVMVLEMISGGELFERIIDEDFELTEREVIKYMLQIIDGVSFIHKQGIVHLDLKPENIMCVNKTGSKIKLIDFGLARRLENAGTLKVLFGTPEFVAPEVINYEAISYPTDMWSIGVICYILLSGLSPFMGDNDNETLSNVTSATWDFEDEAFDEISDNAKDFITNLLKKDMRARLTCAKCFEHPWLKQDTNTMKAKKLSKERMKKYILRRKWQKTGHAVRAIGRLSTMAMMAGVTAKKGSPTEEDNQFLECLEYEQKTECKPSFSAVIRDVEVVEGSAARFDCKIEGYPDPEVVWYKDDQPIKETRHFQIDYDEDGNCSLVISEVSGDDDAKYTVKAVNSVGEATCTAELLVEVMAGEEEEEEEEEE